MKRQTAIYYEIGSASFDTYVIIWEYMKEFVRCSEDQTLDCLGIDEEIEYYTYLVTNETIKLGILPLAKYLHLLNKNFE